MNGARTREQRLPRADGLELIDIAAELFPQDPYFELAEKVVDGDKPGAWSNTLCR